MSLIIWGWLGAIVNLHASTWIEISLSIDRFTVIITSIILIQSCKVTLGSTGIDVDNDDDSDDVDDDDDDDDDNNLKVIGRDN